ncbi:MAG: T9SS C-terminal target domain-containing protein [Bacteroidetes bacterium]|nr:MAG: T9SS C-terminal target domain-containing protein [Bacteroidota bacterium]
MKKKLPMLFALMLVFAISNMFAQDLLVLHSMDTETASAATSANRDDVNYEVAENFTGVNGTVNQIVVYGLYAIFDDGWANADPGAGPLFNIRFYESDPEVEPNWGNASLELFDMPSTIEAEEPWGNGFNVWKYTIDIPDTYLDDGWIGVQSSGGDGWFLWHKSLDDDLFAWQKNYNDKGNEFAFIGADSGAKVGALEYDLAVELYGVAGNGEETTVVDIIVGSEVHTTLATAVTLAGLVDALSGEGPFTVFAPTDDAFDALPDGLLDDLLDDPEGALTSVLLYHVVEGNVMAADLSDEQEITTLLGQILTVSIDGGDVFIVDSEGNESQVTVPDLVADNGVVHVVDGVLIPDLTVQMFDVTFNVDMEDAVAEGDVVFDPEIHRVFVTGSFAGWVEPGSDETFELLPAPPAKSKNTVVVFEEAFLVGNDTGALPEGWEVKKADNALGNNLQDLEEGDQRWHLMSPSFFIYENFTEAWVKEGEGAMHCNWNVQAVQNAYAITPDIVLPEADEVWLEYWKFFVHDLDEGWLTEYNLLIHSDGAWDLLNSFDSDDGTNMYDDPVMIDISAYNGHTIRLAWVLKWTDGIQMTIDDISVTAYGVAGDPDPDPVNNIYTLTVPIEEGTHQYKYFLIVDEPTWGIGEWPGDPNRQIIVDADKTVNDVFGVQPVNVVENELAEEGIKLFPNPVQHTLYVENSEMINSIRIFDLTGRMVYSQVVNDNTTSVNVSEFKTGVYIMQVMTANGVASQKFNVR